MRASLEVADIFRAAGPAYRATHAGHLSLHQLKVMSAIEHCRTAALGGHVEACEDCGHRRIAYNSCRNRHCPKCQGAAARTWLAEREADLLPVGYFHVVFTLPAEVADIAFHNKAVVYDLLFRAASETMLTIAADPTSSRRAHRHHRRAPHLGLGDDAPSAHPHDRAGRRHFAGWHALGVVPAGLSAAGPCPVQTVPPPVPDAAACTSCRRRGSPSSVTTPGCARNAPSRHLVARLRKKHWVVYAKPPFGGPEAVLAYLSRYTHRVAISNRRLISLDESGVTFRYKDYRRDGAERYRTMTLTTDEFIRRFLLHVLPKGFHRIRHYGLLASAARRANVARARALLAVPPVAEPAEPVELTEPQPPCPCCGGRMIIIETFQRWMQPRAPPASPASTGMMTP